MTDDAVLAIMVTMLIVADQIDPEQRVRRISGAQKPRASYLDEARSILAAVRAG
jgi:hypothetical protein